MESHGRGNEGGGGGGNQSVVEYKWESIENLLPIGGRRSLE